MNIATNGYWKLILKKQKHWSSKNKTVNQQTFFLNGNQIANNT